METQWGTLLKHDIAFNIDREGPSPDRTSQMERERGGGGQRASCGWHEKLSWLQMFQLMVFKEKRSVEVGINEEFTLC